MWLYSTIFGVIFQVFGVARIAGLVRVCGGYSMVCSAFVHVLARKSLDIVFDVW